MFGGVCGPEDEETDVEEGEAGPSREGTVRVDEDDEAEVEVDFCFGTEGWMDGDERRSERCKCRCVVIRLLRCVCFTRGRKEKKSQSRDASRLHAPGGISP